MALVSDRNNDQHTRSEPDCTQLLNLAGRPGQCRALLSRNADSMQEMNNSSMTRRQPVDQQRPQFLARNHNT
jgi:hypothetical protein